MFKVATDLPLTCHCLVERLSLQRDQATPYQARLIGESQSFLADGGDLDKREEKEEGSDIYESDSDNDQGGVLINPS